MSEATLVFTSEDERMTAIRDLGDNPDNLEKLNAIREAKIGAKPAEGDVKPPEPKEPTKPPEAPVAPVEPKTFTLTDKDLPAGFDSPGKVFKSYSEAQDLIKRQSEKIKELVSGSTARTPGEQAAMERAERAERDLEQLRKGAPAAPQQGTAGNIATVSDSIKQIETMQAELEAEAEKDPDIAFTSNYQKKMRELSKLQTKNFNSLAGLLTQAQHEIGETRKATSEFVQGQQRTKEEDNRRNELQKQYDEINKIDIPEFKLSKPSDVVEGEFVKWRDDVSLAFYGRPAADTVEKFNALEQLQLKNPDLLKKCQLMGVSAEPTDDIARYVQVCEMIDYADGYRKDPATGKYTRLMRYDPATQTQVPLVMPSLKAAIQQKRLEDGYYEKQRDGAFQAGAESLAAAASRRDQGAVTLDQRDQGQTGGTQKWAYDTLTNIDPEDAVREYRKGNKAKFDEINKARKLLGQDPIVFPDEA